MNKFKGDIRRFKYFCWTAGIAIIGILVINCLGCSSTSVAKQKKAALLIGQQIEFIGDGVIAKCNDGTMNEDNCAFIADLINFALDSQNTYARTLIAMQNGTGSQEQVQKALEDLQDDVAVLISNAIGLGIKVKAED